MGARTALVALLSALSLPGVRPSPSALGLGTSRRLAPMAQAVRALPADYKWDVLVNTAVYGETPKTFTKRKQVEFLEALAQTVRLQWQWGSTKGGAPLAAARGTVSLHAIHVGGATGEEHNSIRTILSVGSNSLTTVHEVVSQIESERFAHDLAEKFSEVQYRKEILVKQASETLSHSDTAAQKAAARHQSQRADVLFEVLLVNELPGTFNAIKQHELLVCIATLLRAGYRFNGNMNDPMGWSKRRGTLDMTKVDAGDFGGAPAVKIHFKLHSFAPLAKKILHTVDSPKFLSDLTPMIAPMMAVVGTKKINLVDFRWAFIGPSTDARLTHLPLTVMMNYVLEDEPAELFTLYRQREFANAVAAAASLPPRQVRVASLKNHHGGSHISMLLYFGKDQCAKGGGKSGSGGGSTRRLLASRSTAHGGGTPSGTGAALCDPHSPSFVTEMVATKAFQMRAVRRLQRRGVRIRIGADDVVRQTAVAVRRKPGWWDQNKFAYVSTSGWKDIADSEEAHSGVRIKSVVIGLSVAAVFALVSVKAAARMQGGEGAGAARSYSRVGQDPHLSSIDEH